MKATKVKAVSALLAFGIPFALVAFTPMPHVKVPEKLDILGMIRKINNNNNDINSVNSNIVGDMKQINNLSGTTARIHEHLVTLKQGISEQDQSLANLQNLSGRQVELSTSLNKLAQSLDADLQRVNNSSAQQKGSVEQMMQATDSLARLAKEVTDINSGIAEKLDRASKATGQVVSNMP